jgi:predicted short-subunit dehydrogenase-like oxidoreductase (DUF2520 family)
LKLKYKIVILGTGNLATHLISALSKIQSIEVIQLFNHQPSLKAKKLAKNFCLPIVFDINKIETHADLYIIAVKDQFILNLSEKLSKLNLKGLVTHTSGSQSIEILKNSFPKIGVIYPLQSFYPNASINWKETPILIEANYKSELKNLKRIFSILSDTVVEVDSENRQQLHLAAVFACNFTNALYVSAFQLIENNFKKNDVKLLFPIMKQSFEKLENTHPLKAQSGPAVRNDLNVIKTHQNMLKSNKELLSIYNQLTQLIQHQQKNN